ncbi:hypothetical protein [Trinickia sp.]|jgi:hypothetical protein|uniref:hypothetical protein n=1 Tax=Trinickia sp. TaxID=2571163 RepID=UPI003F7F9572
MEKRNGPARGTSEMKTISDYDDNVILLSFSSSGVGGGQGFSGPANISHRYLIASWLAV